MNDIFDVIRHRRSIRHYTAEAVPVEMVRRALEAARWAPSGLNNQPWRFLAVGRDDPRREAMAGLTKYGRVVREAGVCVAVFLDKGAAYNQVKDCQGIGAAIQNMLLAFQAQGLGAVWIGEIINQEPEVTRALGLDDGKLALMAVIAAGWPAREGASSRKALHELLLEPLPGE